MPPSSSSNPHCFSTPICLHTRSKKPALIGKTVEKVRRVEKYVVNLLGKESACLSDMSSALYPTERLIECSLNRLWLFCCLLLANCQLLARRHKSSCFLSWNRGTINNWFGMQHKPVTMCGSLPVWYTFLPPSGFQLRRKEGRKRSSDLTYCSLLMIINGSCPLQDRPSSLLSPATAKWSLSHLLQDRWWMIYGEEENDTSEWGTFSTSVWGTSILVQWAPRTLDCQSLDLSCLCNQGEGRRAHRQCQRPNLSLYSTSSPSTFLTDVSYSCFG